jgi:hypothetical protein
MAVIKKPNAGKDVGEREPLQPVGRVTYPFNRLSPNHSDSAHPIFLAIYLLPYHNSSLLLGKHIQCRELYLIQIFIFALDSTYLSQSKERL